MMPRRGTVFPQRPAFCASNFEVEDSDTESEDSENDITPPARIRLGQCDLR